MCFKGFGTRPYFFPTWYPIRIRRYPTRIRFVSNGIRFVSDGIRFECDSHPTVSDSNPIRIRRYPTRIRFVSDGIRFGPSRAEAQADPKRSPKPTPTAWSLPPWVRFQEDFLLLFTRLGDSDFQIT
jgi:hypothetical protein